MQKREIYEESGFKVELTGLAGISNRVTKDDTFIGIIFSTKILSGEIRVNPEEMLDVKFFTYDEIINMKDKLRSEDFILNAINAVENKNIKDIDLINIIK